MSPGWNVSKGTPDAVHSAPSPTEAGRTRPLFSPSAGPSRQRGEVSDSGGCKTGGASTARVQQVLVQTSGNVILSLARCCSSSFPSVSNRNTLKARWSIPVGVAPSNRWLSHLLAAPTMLSGGMHGVRGWLGRRTGLVTRISPPIFAPPRPPRPACSKQKSIPDPGATDRPTAAATAAVPAWRPTKPGGWGSRGGPSPSPFPPPPPPPGPPPRRGGPRRGRSPRGDPAARGPALKA